MLKKLRKKFVVISDFKKQNFGAVFQICDSGILKFAKFCRILKFG